MRSPCARGRPLRLGPTVTPADRASQGGRLRGRAARAERAGEAPPADGGVPELGDRKLWGVNGKKWVVRPLRLPLTSLPK